MVCFIPQKISAPPLLMVSGEPGRAGVPVLWDAVDTRQGRDAGNATILHLQMEEWTALEFRMKMNIVKFQENRKWWKPIIKINRECGPPAY